MIEDLLFLLVFLCIQEKKFSGMKMKIKKLFTLKKCLLYLLVKFQVKTKEESSLHELLKLIMKNKTIVSDFNSMFERSSKNFFVSDFLTCSFCIA